MVGILTDKDIAYRVVALGLDVRTTPVSQVMSRDPISVSAKGNRIEALNIMVSKKFRHLPVLSDLEESGDEHDKDAAEMPSSTVVGLLDITKCVFDRLDELQIKSREEEQILSAMELIEQRGGSAVVEAMGAVMNQIQGCPSVGSVLVGHPDDLQEDVVPEVTMKASVKDAALVMKEHHQTAVLVLSAGEKEDRVAGILTTKDIVLRVLAANLDPNTTSAVRVMVCYVREHKLISLDTSSRLCHDRDDNSGSSTKA